MTIIQNILKRRFIKYENINIRYIQCIFITFFFFMFQLKEFNLCKMKIFKECEGIINNHAHENIPKCEEKNKSLALSAMLYTILKAREGGSQTRNMTSQHTLSSCDCS